MSANSAPAPSSLNFARGARRWDQSPGSTGKEVPQGPGSTFPSSEQPRIWRLFAGHVSSSAVVSWPSSVLVLRDTGQAFGGLPGHLQARGTHFAPVIRLPQRWDYQGLVQVSQEAGWRAPWETQTKKCSECYCLNIICHFCLECSNGGLLGEKIGGTKKGMEGPPFRIHSNPSLLGPFTSCVILEVIALVLCLLWRTVAGYQVSGSSESLTIISN